MTQVYVVGNLVRSSHCTDELEFDVHAVYEDVSLAKDIAEKEYFDIYLARFVPSTGESSMGPGDKSYREPAPVSYNEGFIALNIALMNALSSGDYELRMYKVGEEWFVSVGDELEAHSGRGATPLDAMLNLERVYHA